MEEKTFRALVETVYRESGIRLGSGKQALVSARVSKRMRALGLEGYEEYLEHLRANEATELVALLDVISTNVTSFFREGDHFELVEDAVAGWLSKGQRRLRFWSAACSTGEEPYSLAMTLLEASRGHGADMRILATDISTKVLETCRAGRYPENKMGGISKALRGRYFERCQNGHGPVYEARDSLKRMILFRRLNLSTPPFPMRGPLDVILCRNVMIYFDNEVRRRLLEDMYRLLRPGGYLLVGHAESLTGMMSELTPVRPSVYTKKR